MNKPVLVVDNLCIGIGLDHPKVVVDGISFTLNANETLCIAGESGSGKSLTGLALMGLLPDAVRVLSGRILYQGDNILEFPRSRRRKLRGKDFSMIFQEPMSALNPLMTAGGQIVEAITVQKAISRAEAKQEALRMLDAVKVPHPKRRFRQYPHEMSGGMLQRIMIAMALVGEPKVLIADEPTTALDVTIQAQILTLLNELRTEFNTGVIMITHDMGVVAEMADRVVVMNKGVVEEVAKVRALFESPEKPYTQKLLNSVPVLGQAPAPTDPISTDLSLLQVQNLRVRFDLGSSFWTRKNWKREKMQVRAVEDVSFALSRGETLGLVGESGCGKSTTGMALMNLIPFQGNACLDGLQMHGIGAHQLKTLRKEIQMVFQDPYSSLNPRKRILTLLAEPLLIHKVCDPKDVKDEAAELLKSVDLSPDMLSRFPHQFSGGQRQRIGIARAIASKPKLIIADESVSALDVSVQAQVLELLQRLQQERGLSYLFISHDIAVVEVMSHRVAVMRAGRIVETGPRQEVMQSPKHEYTQLLMQAVPIPQVDRKKSWNTVLEKHRAVNPIFPSTAPDIPIEYKEIAPGHLVATNY